MNNASYAMRSPDVSGRGMGPAHEAPRLAPLQTIWHRRWIVVGSVVIGVIGALVLSHFMPKVYTRTARIVVEPASVKSMGEGASSMEAYLNTQAELIAKSAAIHADAINLLAETGGLSGTGPDTLAALRANLTATPGKNDNVITVAYSSPSSVEAARVVNAIVDSYASFTSTDSRKSNGDNINKIEADKDKWEQELHERHTQLANIKGEISKLRAAETVGNDTLQSMKVLQEAIASTQLESINTQATFEEFAKANITDAAKLDKLLNTGEFNGSIITPASDGEQIKNDRYLATRHLNDLKERYLPNHPAVQAAQAKYDDLTASTVLYLHQRWVSASNKAKLLQSRYDSQQKLVAENTEKVSTALATKSTEYAEIEKSLGRTEKLTDLLSTRLQEMSSADRIGAVRISPLDRPDPFMRVAPSRPNRPIMLLEGLMIGLIFGITLALADPRVRSVEEVITATGLPILGVIPHMKRSLSLQSRGRKMHLDPISDVSEAYRAIRSGVLFGPKGKTILVTSPIRGEGKSTSAANLAIAMAEAGHRILLVDADLRDPVQHRIFALTNDAGVSTIVAGRGSLDRVIQGSGVRGLDVLPCGPVPFNPSEIINNQAFADLLSDLGQRYDYVIVDSPPVMSVTDARILAAMCDLSLLVIRAERSNRRSVQDARDGLLGFGGNIIGVIVNDGRRNRQRYGYYGGYGRTSEPFKPNCTRPVTEPPATMNTDFMFTAKQ